MENVLALGYLLLKKYLKMIKENFTSFTIPEVIFDYCIYIKSNCDDIKHNPLNSSTLTNHEIGKKFIQYYDTPKIKKNEFTNVADAVECLKIMLKGFFQNKKENLTLHINHDGTIFLHRSLDFEDKCVIRTIDFVFGVFNYLIEKNIIDMNDFKRFAKVFNVNEDFVDKRLDYLANNDNNSYRMGFDMRLKNKDILYY